MAEPLAAVFDLESRLGRQLEGSDLGRAVAVLEDVSALARDVAGQTWLNVDGSVSASLPTTVKAVVLKSAERAMRNPDGYSAESGGDYSYQRVGVQDGVYLTDREEKLIRRAIGRAGLWTQPVTRGEDECTTVFMEDSFGCELFPIDTVRNW
jgi:hypothetical protein